MRASTFVLLVWLGGCASAPTPTPSVQREAQYAQPPPVSSAFAPVAQVLATKYGPQKSGFLMLDDNRSALDWRLRLIDSARHTIDLQYYLWYGDTVGSLMAHRIFEAADRGVRVRLLVDDLNTLLKNAGRVSQRDRVVAWLDAHPNIELRLFNPWTQRGLGARAGESLANIERVNQRMHNKSLIVDNTAVIIGGRNLGDEYMGLNSDFNFRDLDVLGVGPVAVEASAVFDTFWNSDWVLPVDMLGIEIPPEEQQDARAGLLKGLGQAKALENIPVDPGDWSADLATLAGQLLPGIARVVSDLPDGDTIQRHMLDETRSLIRSSGRQVALVNAYIIPVSETIDMLEDLQDRGVEFDVLTNSLASHDVPAVNSHYKAWRKPLLKAGVNLYELRHDGATQATLAETPPTRGKFMGLHSKAMAVDGRWVYIGSMNYDPRSAAINTEMGVFVDSSALAQYLYALIERDIEPANSWRVHLDTEGDLLWSNSDGSVKRQPARSWWQRVEDVFFMMFPRELY
jgi:putative cardiolipin synthase